MKEPIKINRERYVVLNKKNEIFCGLARNYCFKPLNNLGDTAIKTYSSYDKALSSFCLSWNGVSKDNFFTQGYRIITIQESYLEKRYYWEPIKTLKSGIVVYRVMYDGVHYVFGHKGDKTTNNFAEYDVAHHKFYFTVDKEIDTEQIIEICEFIKTTSEYKDYLIFMKRG